MEATKPKSSTTLCSLAYREGEKILKERSEEKKKEEGQFLTPPKIARYIARKVEPLPETTRLLDPAIGSGVLPCAIIERTIERGWPKQIELAGYETDDELGRAARYVLTQAKERAADAGVDVRFDISPSDFVLEHAPNSSPSLFNQENSENEFETFDAIIANPPYFKLNRSDPQAQAVMGEVEGHTNIYTLFMGLAARMLSPEGRSCFIVPRSFCSGAYFKSFREDFLRRVLPEHVHVFVSREKAFDGDSVLQENVIFSLTARGPDEDFESVDMSTSRGVEDLVVGPTDHSRTVPASLFVGEGQKSIYYRLPSCDLDEKILELVDSWEGSFEKHRLEVSTGPVVAFRSRPLLTDYDDVYDGNALPLMWMQNIRPGTVEWPTDRRNKSQGILDNQDAEDLLVPSENYVLIRRFSSKEDRRRLTAAPFLSRTAKIRWPQGGSTSSDSLCLNCIVSGSPAHPVRWFKRPMSGRERGSSGRRRRTATAPASPSGRTARIAGSAKRLGPGPQGYSEEEKDLVSRAHRERGTDRWSRRS